MTSSVTVVVPVYNDLARLRTLLVVLDKEAARAAATLPVVVSDDGSDPMIGDAVAEELTWLAVSVIRGERSAGPGAARNRALPLVDTEWVAFLDADMRPSRGWLNQLHQVIGDDECDVIEGPVKVPDAEEPTPFTHTTEFDQPGTHHGAGNVAMRTALLRSIGGFDERYFDRRRRLHFREDTDLFFRLEKRGARVRYDETLVAEHPLLPASIWSPVRLARRYAFDPLLSREHPTEFRRLVRTRRLGAISLRKARHAAAHGFVAAAVGLVASLAAGATAAVVGFFVVLVLSLLANVVGVAWGRRVRGRDLLPLALVGGLVAFVYTWHHWRGVLRFRHHPRF